MKQSDTDSVRVQGRKLGKSWKHWDGNVERHECALDEGPGLYFALLFLGMIISTILLTLNGYLLIQRAIPDFPIAIPVIIFIIGAPLSIWWVAYLCCVAIVAWRVRLVSFPWLSKWLPMQVPYLAFLGGIFGVSRDRVSSSCIAVTNSLAMLRLRPDVAQGPLVLLPRCMKASTVRAIKDIGAEKNCPVEVMATNKMARQKVGEYRPTVVLAVACERDLVSGLYDFGHKLPILVVANTRPEGPCLRCDANLQRFRKHLEAICEGDVEDEELPPL